jgi:ABC-type lipoprotein export system ATPase subunit
VRVTGLSHAFGNRHVLRDVTLHVPAGQSVAITGSSGSGKTTLLSCMLGLIRPRTGTVHLAGVDITRLSRRQRAILRSSHVGMVFQHGELVPYLTAEENVALPALMAGRNPAALARARELLAELGVTGATLAGDLSGGEVQRAALARALINDPTIIFADEPTGSLDADLRDAAAERLFTIPKQRECALVVVTHDPAVAERADITLHLHEGTLRQQ